jgi:mannose-6-phosphate isomerase class I
LELRRKLISLIFGEKTRWHEMDYQENPKSPFGSLWMLFYHAIQNAYVSTAFKMTMNELWNDIRKLFKKGV